MKPDRISSPIDSLESKWWYRLPDRIPAASAISRTVVARKPFSANRWPASVTRCARRSEVAVTRSLWSVAGTCPNACSGNWNLFYLAPVVPRRWIVRAAVLHSIEDGKISIRDDVEAVGPGPGEVRIRVRAAGVCHSDLSARIGTLPQPAPAILGHEAAGDVVAIGDGVDDLAVGDRVIANWLPACGSCRSCLRHEPYLCVEHVMLAYVRPRFLASDGPVFGMAGCGAFAEEMVVPRAGAV